MHGTPYDSRAKVVLVALRAVKEYFDCAIDLPAFLTIEKSHVQNTCTYFSGTVYRIELRFSHISIYRSWTIYLGLNEVELIDCVNVKLWTQKYWDELQILVITDSDQEIRVWDMQMWFTFIADVYCMKKGSRIPWIFWILFSNTSNHIGIRENLFFHFALIPKQRYYREMTWSKWFEEELFKSIKYWNLRHKYIS